MGGAANKSAAIRAVIARRGRPMTLADLHPLVENKIKQIYGRQKLYTHLSVMQNDDEIVSAGARLTGHTI